MAESDKREAVLVAGRALLLKQGFRATSMEAIAAQAGIAKATLYKYFPDKEAVYLALVGALLTTMDNEFRSGLGAEGTLSSRVARALTGKYQAIARYVADSEHAGELLDVHHSVASAQVQTTEAGSQQALVAALREAGVREPERIAGVLEASAYGLFRKGRGDLAANITTVVEGVLRGM